MAFTEQDLDLFIKQIEQISGTQDPVQWNTLVWETWKTLSALIKEEFIETEIKVYATYNYELLQVLAWQRNVDEAHVDKIIKNILKKWYRFQVGQINDAGEVIDMQHRLAALQKIRDQYEQKLPAFVVVVPQAGQDDVTTLNSVSLTWQSKHFLQSWMNSLDPITKETYTCINKLIEDYSLPCDIVINMIGQHLNHIPNRKDQFKNKTIEYSVVHDRQMRQFFDDVIELNQLLFENKKPTTRFITATVVLFSQNWFNFKLLKEKFKTQNPYIDKLRNLSYQSSEWIYELFAQIYNYKARSNTIPEWRKQAKKYPTLSLESKK